jgi:hypothetical protein
LFPVVYQHVKNQLIKLNTPKTHLAETLAADL